MSTLCQKLIWILLPFLALHAAAQPVITSFSPAIGPAGTAVTVAGSGFNSIPDSNIVYFGAVRAAVTAGSATSLVVRVPAGATYEPVSVLNAATGLSGSSAKPFVLTFPNSHGTGLSASFFLPRVNFNTGNYPEPLALGDLDGDGKPE